MEIILKEDVINLGYKDDIVKVKDGYGRNYLIPMGKAVIATESAKKVLAENQRQRARKMEQIKKNAESLAEKFKGVALTLSAKASESGKIYGSVTNVQLAEELEKIGISVDRKSIFLSEPIKELGSYEALVKIHRDIQATFPFTVVAEAEEAAAPSAE